MKKAFTGADIVVIPAGIPRKGPPKKPSLVNNEAHKPKANRA
jgi:malate/lactate dehydrogenase